MAARTISGRRDGRFAGRARLCSILSSMTSRRSARTGAVPGADGGPVPPHRPSRRIEIVEAAIRVFAESPLSQATVEQVAAEARRRGDCRLLPLRQQGRPVRRGLPHLPAQRHGGHRRRSGPGPPRWTRRRCAEVINASWAFFRTHPVEARFFLLHSGGATPESRRAFDDWNEFHARRAFDYLPEDERPSPSSRKGREMYAARLLAFQFLNRLAERQPDGLARRSAGQTFRQET